MCAANVAIWWPIHGPRTATAAVTATSRGRCDSVGSWIWEAACKAATTKPTTAPTARTGTDAMTARRSACCAAYASVAGGMRCLLGRSVDRGGRRSLDQRVRHRGLGRSSAGVRNGGVARARIPQEGIDAGVTRGIWNRGGGRARVTTGRDAQHAHRGGGLRRVGRATAVGVGASRRAGRRYTIEAALAVVVAVVARVYVADVTLALVVAGPRQDDDGKEREGECRDGDGAGSHRAGGNFPENGPKCQRRVGEPSTAPAAALYPAARVFSLASTAAAKRRTY